jgi:hypothetical protein
MDVTVVLSLDPISLSLRHKHTSLAQDMKSDVLRNAIYLGSLSTRTSAL